MKKFRTLIITLFIIALIASAFAGCSPDTDEAEEPDATAEVVADVEEEEEVVEEEVMDEGITFPVTQDIAIEFMMVSGPSGQEPNDSAVKTWLEEETGIAINIISVVSANTVEKVQVMMAAGEYPDVFLGSILRTDDVTKYGPSGVFLDSNDFISQDLTPNLYQLLLDRPEAKGVCTAPDGGLYSIPMLSEVEGGYLEFFWIINDNFLEAVGMDKPTTMDEMYLVLKAFKEQDANGNGLDDEIGTAFAANHWASHFEGVLSSWGMPTKPGAFENLSYLENGKVTFAPGQDAYKSAITYYNKLQNEGLLDIESFTQDADTLNAKIGDTEVQTIGITAYWTDPPEGYSYMTPPSADGITPRWYIHPGYLGIKNRLVVTNKHEQPEYIYALLDAYFYDFENSLKFGHGDSVMVNGDGTYTFKPLPDSYDNWGDFIYDSGGLTGGAIGHMTKDEFNLFTNDLVDNPKANVARVNAYFKGGYQAVANKEIWPRPYSIAENVDELLAIKADIFAAVDQKKAEWIMGDVGMVDEEWDEFQAQLKAMGLDRMMELLQMDYDVYKAGQTLN